MSTGTIVGNDLTICVVDDPDGVVVPSPGVRVIGHRASFNKSVLLTKAHEIARNVQLAREHDDFLRPIRNAMRDQQPKLPKRAQKQRLKGLRP